MNVGWKKAFFTLIIMVLGSIALEARASKYSTIIEWDEIEDAQKYILEVSNNKEFRGRPLMRRESERRAFAFSAPKPGVYYFRIAYIDAFGRESPFGKPEPFTFHPETPSVQSPASDLVLDSSSEDFVEQIPFTWSKPDTVDAVEFQLARDPEFEDIAVSRAFEAPGFRMNTPHQEGDYYWRVRSSMSDGTTSDWTPSKQLSVKRPEPVPIEEIVEEDMLIVEDDMPEEEEERLEFAVRQNYITFGLVPQFGNSNMKLDVMSQHTERSFGWDFASFKVSYGHQTTTTWSFYTDASLERYNLASDEVPANSSKGDYGFTRFEVNGKFGYRLFSHDPDYMGVITSDANARIYELTFGYRLSTLPTLQERGTDAFGINSISAHFATFGGNLQFQLSPRASAILGGDLAYPLMVNSGSLRSPLFYNARLLITHLFDNDWMFIYGGELRYQTYKYDVADNERGSAALIHPLINLSVGYRF